MQRESGCQSWCPHGNGLSPGYKHVLQDWGHAMPERNQTIAQSRTWSLFRAAHVSSETASNSGQNRPLHPGGKPSQTSPDSRPQDSGRALPSHGGLTGSRRSETASAPPSEWLTTRKQFGEPTERENPQKHQKRNRRSPLWTARCCQVRPSAWSPESYLLPRGEGVPSSAPSGWPASSPPGAARRLPSRPGPWALPSWLGPSRRPGGACSPGVVGRPWAVSPSAGYHRKDRAGSP